jgi:lysophospholipase L1-like esterase
LEKMSLKLSPGQKWVFIGDSITDANRARPVGEGLFGAIGTGYVSYVDAFLQATYPSFGLRLVNMGSSGNTVRDLTTRWETDVLGLKPDWLSIMIGTNDVWRQYDLPTQTEAHVPLDEYRTTLDALITQAQPGLQGLILATPFYIEPYRNDAMRKRMDEYGSVVKDLATKYNAILVDTQAAFDQALEHIYPATLAWDRVHPNHAGTAIIAKAFLNAVGFEWQTDQKPTA